MDFEQWKLAEGTYWRVFLHDDQTVPGRIYFWYSQSDILDLLDAPKEALAEFYDIALKVRAALSKAFQPDMFNYLSLSNKTQHLHIHLIPRYAKDVKLFGHIFKDAAFGHSYERDHNLALSDEVKQQIKMQIEQYLK